jgi:cytidine deaminase
LLTESGDVFAGCNVENATFGATVCAERNAIAAAVLAADTNLQALVVICPADRPVAPCGICRQVLAEFADDLPILLATPDGQRELVNLTELLPHRFGSSDFT